MRDPVLCNYSYVKVCACLFVSVDVQLAYKGLSFCK